MAKITGFQDGSVNDSGKVNWRGDQTTAPNAQSIYNASQVQLAELGARMVVGDRVFRYAQLGGVASTPGDVLQTNLLPRIPTTGGGTSAAGGRTFIFYNTGSASTLNQYAEGTLHCVSGTAANVGQMYRIKSHASTADGANVTLTLYDPLLITEDVIDLWAVNRNPYKLVTQVTAGLGAVPIAGVLVCAATTNDYVWIQTWGPAAVKAQTSALAGGPIYAAATGAAVGFIATGTGGAIYTPIGIAMTVPVASDRALAFLQIAP
mgnify:FL=1